MESSAEAAPVTITVNPANSRPISPWIYGINFYEAIPDAPRNLTLNRAGGNRWTAYNWENNASNAGSDWYYQSDTYLSSSTIPGEAVRPKIAANRTLGMASLITLQLQGYVAADTSGPVNINDPNRFTTRFRQVVARKGAAFTATPPTTDANVYMDEFLWALRGKFSGDIYADPTAPVFVSLDNEPELWPYTHAQIQTGPPPIADFIQKTVAMAGALKDVAPAVQIFGPVHYGFNGIVNWQNDPSIPYGSYWFTDKYLDEMKAASTAAGRRLLDAYDFHWYSEARSSGTRIGAFTGTTLTDAQVQAIVQSPRSLWGPTYTEDSWVAEYLGGPVNILGRLQGKIDARWPGTKLAVTEYENGGNNHIAGAIAQADNLGIFGQLGIFAANFWPTSATYPFALAAFRMYRDYDGNLGSFGDVSLPATSSDTGKVAAYVSRDSARPGRHVIVALNRSTAAHEVSFNGLAVSGAARIYRVAGTSAAPVFVGQEAANLASWVVTLPALSVSTIEITPQVTTGSATQIDFDAATLNGTANPGGLATAVRFEYGLTTAYGTSTASQSIGAGTANVTVSAAITGLSPGTTYHYRLVVTNSSGTTYGVDRTFTTPDAGVVGAWAVRTVVRNLPTVAGRAVEIGAFTFAGSAGSMEVALNVSDGAGKWSVAKRYVIPIRSNLTGISPANTWLTVLPAHDPGAFYGNNCELEMKVSGATATLRVRTTAYSAGTPVATIVIKTMGLQSLVDSTVAAAVAAPTAVLGSSVVTEVAGKAGVGAIPSGSAALDLSGGNTKGLRLRPRTTTGAPTTGAWSKGTLIIDVAGNLYVCTQNGTPGTWKKVGAP